MACVIGFQDGQRRVVRLAPNEAPGPAIDRALGVGRLDLPQGAEVRNLLLRIGEEEGLGRRIETVNRQGRPVRMVRQFEGGDDAQPIGAKRLGPFQEADRIVEGVMRQWTSEGSGSTTRLAW
jgi:hypothetical protein